MHWTIREAHAPDAEALALVGAATLLETFAGVLDGGAIVAHCLGQHSADWYRRSLADGASAWLALAAPGDAPIGFALVARPDLPGADPAGGDVELKRIYALSRAHGSGVGAALMAAAVARAREQGARRLLLGVYAGNARALAFYRRQGFERIADRRFRVGDRDYDDIVLAKPL